MEKSWGGKLTSVAVKAVSMYGSVRGEQFDSCLPNCPRQSRINSATYIGFFALLGQAGQA